MPKHYTVVDESVQKKSRKGVEEGFGFGFGGACSPNALLGELESTGGFDDIMNALSDGLVGIGVVGIEADSLEDAVSKLISQVGAMACQMGVAQNTDDYTDDEYVDDFDGEYDDNFDEDGFDDEF